jgi:hypothetical protein
MNLRYEFHGTETHLVTGCNQSGCHSNLSSLDYHGVQSAVAADLDTLFQLLGVRGWIDTVATSSNYGQVRATPNNPLIIRPARRAGALYNYFYVEHDLSVGVHNPPYAKELLRSSIEELRNNP